MKANLFWAAFMPLKKLWKVFLVQSDSLTETPINKSVKVLKMSALDLGVSDARLLCLVKDVREDPIPAEMPNQKIPAVPASPSIFPGQALSTWTGKILTKQKHTHLLVRFVNTKRSLKFRNFKRSTTNCKLLQVWNKWKKSSFGANSPISYMKSLSPVKAFEVLSNLWSTSR